MAVSNKTILKEDVRNALESEFFDSDVEFVDSWMEFFRGSGRTGDNCSRQGCSVRCREHDMKLL